MNCILTGGSVLWPIVPHWQAMMHPVDISALGVGVGVVDEFAAVVQVVRVRIVHEHSSGAVVDGLAVEKTLKGMFTISTVLMSPAVVAISWMALPLFDERKDCWHFALAILSVHGKVSSSDSRVAGAQKESVVTGRINGYAQFSSRPHHRLKLVIAIFFAHSLCGLLLGL